MRFEFYSEAIAGLPKLSVDGTAENSIHFSHWKNNKTDPSIKADTSTEIALNAVSGNQFGALTNGIELVTNNHFDTDGLLSVWVMLTGERANELREPLIAAAEAGDFSEAPNPNAVRTSIVMQGADYPILEGLAAPLARQMNGGASVSEERAYELLLPVVEDVIRNVDRYEPLWRDEWLRIERTLESFEANRSRIIEYEDCRLSLAVLDRNDFAVLPGDMPINPYTALAKNAQGRVYLVARPVGDGWSYRVDYPYYSWAETVRRPPVKRVVFQTLISELNEMERARGATDGRWVHNDSELSSAFNYEYGAKRVPSGLDPETVAMATKRFLSSASTGE
jgi:hypothetical protein